MFIWHNLKGRGILISGVLALWSSGVLVHPLVYASTDEKEAFYAQAWSRFEEGRFEEAKKIFSDFKNKFPDPVLSEEADYKIAECLYNLKDYPALKEHLRLVLEKYPATPLLEFYLAEGYFYTQEYPQAIASYQKTIESLSDSFLKNSVYLGLGWSYLKVSDYSRAADYFEKLLQNQPSEEEKENALLGKAEALYGLKDYPVASSVYQTLADNSLDRQKQILSLGRIAELSYQQNSPDKALELYEKILKDYPDCNTCDFVYNNLGIMMFNSGNYKRTIELFNILTNKYPQSSFLENSNYYLGRAYYENGEYLNSYLKLREFFSKTASWDLKYDAMFLAGLCLKELKRWPEAYNNFRDIVKESPADVSLLAKAELESAQCLYYSGDKDEALKKYEFLRTKYPDSEISGLVLWRLAEHYFQEDKLALAKRYLLSLINAPAQSLLTGEAYVMLAECYEREGALAKAVDYYRKSLGRENIDQDALRFKLGECLEEIDQDKQAEAEYQAISPNSLLYVKGLLRQAAIADKGDEREKMIGLYQKIAALKVEESAFALEMIERLKKNGSIADSP